MKPLSDLKDNRDSSRVGKLDAERIAMTIAIRYGFRARDFSIAWDGGNFDAGRSEHELVITSNDGRRASARIDDDALLRKDPWKYLREVDGAFARLSRRTQSRGL
jgi:hypothetical protein